MDGISATLKERGAQYGAFSSQAAIAQMLKKVMRSHGWDKLNSDQREALDHIAVKISRILNGNPNHADSWHDIAGYAVLVEERIKKPSPEVD